MTRRDWKTNLATNNFSGVISETVACLGAIPVLGYDLTAVSLSESQTRLDILWNIIDRNVKILSLKEYQEVMD